METPEAVFFAFGGYAEVNSQSLEQPGRREARQGRVRHCTMLGSRVCTRMYGGFAQRWRDLKAVYSVVVWVVVVATIVDVHSGLCEPHPP